MSHHKWRKEVIWWLWQKRDLFNASALHVTSEQEAEDCRRIGFRGPLAVIRNGVQVPLKTEQNKRKRVVFLSRLHKKKGLDFLIEAWSRLEPAFEDWSLAIAGPDEDGSGMAAERQALGLGCKRVEFTGPLHGEAKSRFLSDAGLFVLPTHSENFGIAIAEAMAHGLPVVTTRGTPWSEVAARGVGWWIELSVDQLTSALREAMALPFAGLTERGARAREWMESDFSWNRVGHDMLELYRWLLGQAERPPFVIEV
jgi:glycosyltransferase involved in cell wall biosynthesis